VDVVVGIATGWTGGSVHAFVLLPFSLISCLAFCFEDDQKMMMKGTLREPEIDLDAGDCQVGVIIGPRRILCTSQGQLASVKKLNRPLTYHSRMRPHPPAAKK